MAKFVDRITRSVNAFLQVRSSDTITSKKTVYRPLFCINSCELDNEDVRCEQWHIGPGLIQHHDITLIGAIHVSAGTWMPILQLNRYIF